VDAFQQRHGPTAIGVAVVKKFGEDRAGQLAALISYYSFICLIPLLMVAVTLLGFLTGRDPSFQTRVLDSTLRDFPVIGSQIRGDVHALVGGGLTLVVGMVLALWSGLGGVKAFQNAMDTVWNVPFARRPGFVPSTLRALMMLVVLGVAALASTFVASLGAFTSGSAGWARIAATGASFLLNVGIFLLAFRILTVAEVSWRAIAPGAAVGAAAWTALDSAGTYYVSHQLRHASEVYGTFAAVIVLLAWLYLGARLTLYASELNVVLRDRLYPRSLLQAPLTPADQRALQRYAQQEQRRPEQDVEVRFDAKGKPG